MLFAFPAYQLLAFIGIISIVSSFEAASSSSYFMLLGAILTIVIGIPVLASWYLSCFLFSLGFFSMLGFPWITRQLESVVKHFRSKN